MKTGNEQYNCTSCSYISPVCQSVLPWGQNREDVTSSVAVSLIHFVCLYVLPGGQTGEVVYRLGRTSIVRVSWSQLSTLSTKPNQFRYCIIHILALPTNSCIHQFAWFLGVMYFYEKKPRIHCACIDCNDLSKACVRNRSWATIY